MCRCVGDGVCMWLPVSALLYEDVDRAKFLAAIKIKDFLDVEEDITVKHSISIDNQFNKSKNCMGAMNSIEFMGATHIWQPADGMDFDEGDRFLATVRQSKPCKPWHSVAWRAAQTCLHITRGSHVGAWDHGVPALTRRDVDPEFVRRAAASRGSRQVPELFNGTRPEWWFLSVYEFLQGIVLIACLCIENHFLQTARAALSLCRPPLYSLPLSCV